MHRCHLYHMVSFHTISLQLGKTLKTPLTLKRHREGRGNHGSATPSLIVSEWTLNSNLGPEPLEKISLQTKRAFSVVADDDELKLLCKAFGFEIKETETRPGATIGGACSWAFRRYKADGRTDSKVIFFSCCFHTTKTVHVISFS